MSSISEKQLERLYNQENLSQREIGERLGVSQATISKRMKELKIKSRNASLWTKKEKDLLKESYPGSKEEILYLFPERSWNAIKLKAMGLGLSKTAEEHRNSDEVAEKLRDLAEKNKIDVDFDRTKYLSYVVGVVDGDGYHDNSGTIGLEVKDEVFADKFAISLQKIGLNPNKGDRRGKITVWASSQVLVSWLRDLEETKLEWLKDTGDPWSYIEGQYDSDGNLHPCGSPRICSYDEVEKEFLHVLLTHLGLKCNIQQNNVWVSKASANKFFDNVESVLNRRMP